MRVDVSTAGERDDDDRAVINYLKDWDQTLEGFLIPLISRFA